MTHHRSRHQRTLRRWLLVAHVNPEPPLAINQLWSRTLAHAIARATNTLARATHRNVTITVHHTPTR